MKRRRGRPSKGDDAMTMVLQLKVNLAMAREIEAAVALAGGNFSEWARGPLLELARRKLAAAGKRR